MTGVLSRYVTREILAHSLGVLAIVLGIFLVRRLSGLLGEAAAGELPASIVFHLLGLRTVVALPSLLPVVFFLGVILGLGRLYEDNEMTALAACGVEPWRVYRAVFALALAFLALTAVLSLSARPGATRMLRDVRKRAVMAFGVGALEPGRFYEVGDGGRVIFAQKRAAKGRSVEDVFIHDHSDGQLSILASERAVENVDEDSGYRFLTLLDGHRYDLSLEDETYEITEYRRLIVRTDLAPDAPPLERGRQSSTADLIGAPEPTAVAELQWRLAMPVSVLLLAMMAIPLSQVDPRRGKFAKLLVAVLAYTVYRQALGTAKTWVEDETISGFPGVWAVHFACLACVLIYFLRPGGGWWRRRRGAAGPAPAAGSRGADASGLR